MQERQDEIKEKRVSKDIARREETNRAFAEIVENERKERLEKSMRLRKMRLVTQ